jgi:hypothetical protein
MVATRQPSERHPNYIKREKNLARPIEKKTKRRRKQQQK